MNKNDAALAGKLFRHMLKPELYAPSPSPLWDDEYISARMLEAHLNPDSDAASRNRDFIRRSAEWIMSQVAAKPERKLLDLGCGPGLYARIFAGKGFEVQGVDLSRRSIDYAVKQNSPGVIYRCGNYLELPLPPGMDAVTMIYCDFGVLPAIDRRMLLKKIHASLAMGGVFIFDVFSPEAYADYADGATVEPCDGGGFWSPEPHICITQRLNYENGTTFLRQIAVLTESAARFYHIWEHVFSRQELAEELALAGFSGVRFYGDAAGSEYLKNSRTIAVVAMK